PEIGIRILGRAARALRHAEGDRRSPERRSAESARVARSEGKARGARRRADAHVARGVRRLHPRGDRAHGGHRESRRHQGAMTMRAARLVIAAAALACAQAWAAKLELIVFPGGFNWPLWIAQDKGFFADNGLEVNITPTPGSVFQMQNLASGKFDIAFTNYDNVVAYMEGQGEAPLPQP